MGKSNAKAYGKSNTTEGVILVRVKSTKILAEKNIAAWELDHRLQVLACPLYMIYYLYTLNYGQLIYATVYLSESYFRQR